MDLKKRIVWPHPLRVRRRPARSKLALRFWSPWQGSSENLLEVKVVFHVAEEEVDAQSHVAGVFGTTHWRYEAKLKESKGKQRWSRYFERERDSEACGFWIWTEKLTNLASAWLRKV